MSTDPIPPASEQTDKSAAVRELLRIRDFRLLWLGQVISNFGDAVTTLATLLLINHLTSGSTTAIAIAAITQAAPRMTVGLVAGVYVDRLDRRRIMIAADILRAVLVLGLVLVDTPGKILLLYLLSLLQSSVTSFFLPARTAYVPAIVPKRALLTANSLGQTGLIIMGVLGAGTAGWLVGTFGTYWPAFIIDAGTYLLSAVFIFQVRAPAASPPSGKADVGVIIEEMLDGFRVIAASRVLIGVLVAQAVAQLGMGMVNVLLVPMVVNVLGLSERWFAVLYLAQTTSMVLGGALITSVAPRIRATRTVSATMVGIGILVALASHVTNVWQLVIVLFAVGWFVAPLQASLMTILQVGVADKMRGRAGAALNTASQSANVLSMAASGVLADVMGVRGVFVLGGAFIVVAGLASSLIFSGQRFRGEREPVLRTGLVPEPDGPTAAKEPVALPVTAEGVSDSLSD